MRRPCRRSSQPSLKGSGDSNIGALHAGDATFHAGWTLHRAMPNTSNQMREVMTIIFFADGSRLLEPRYQERKSPFESLFPGLNPGDAAASDMTPIVYSADEAS
jgi:hypothetical protein